REEQGEFDLCDVLKGIHDKLVRRHPHVFHKTEILTTEEVLDRWERLKAKERENAVPASVLDGVPATFPALLRALRLTEKAARVGFDWVAEEDLLKKMDEELAEFKTAVAERRLDKMTEEMGDLLFVMANLARRHRLDPEEALRQANLKFQRRFRFMERRLERKGKSPSGATLNELETLWEEAKREERKPALPRTIPAAPD
ncbi:MAG: nucleoside triphosphate pyrophosphohydrolase, partial [Acidobacteriota bacterium]